MILYQLVRSNHEAYPRPIFTAEFKCEAIKLVIEQGLTFTEASKKLDIATKLLRTWIYQQERGKLKARLGSSKFTGNQQRIRALERELAISKMEHNDLPVNSPLTTGGGRDET
jgi:transposase